MTQALVIWRASAQHVPWALARLQLLDAAERAHMQSLAHDAARRDRYLLARVLRRIALEAHTGLPAQAWKFATTAHGKPAAVAPAPLDASPAFSLAHTESHVVVALCSCASVGIDVECLDRLDNEAEQAARLLRRVLTTAEQQRVAHLASAHLPRVVLQRFSLKEAVAKATGQGLRGPWRDIDADLPLAPLTSGQAWAAPTPLALPAQWAPYGTAPLWCGLMRPEMQAPLVIAWAAMAAAPPSVRLCTPDAA